MFVTNLSLQVAHLDFVGSIPTNLIRNTWKEQSGDSSWNVENLLINSR